MKGVPADKVELVQWWDLLNEISKSSPEQLNGTLQKARECTHKDAQWLVSLFLAGDEVTSEGLLEALRAQGDDPRAMHLLWLLDAEEVEGTGRLDTLLLRKAAEMGYAPAQADLAIEVGEDEEQMAWTEKAAAQGHRDGLFQLAEFFDYGVEEQSKAVALYKQAAGLGHAAAQHQYGKLAYSELQWERYWWWSRAAQRGFGVYELCNAAIEFLPAFEAGRLGRILFESAVGVKVYLSQGKRGDGKRTPTLQRVLGLYDARCAVAEHAIECWIVAGRRLGVAKDIRMIIAKMAWEERWRWCELDGKGNNDSVMTRLAEVVRGVVFG